MLVTVAIGSNLGNRERNISSAYHGLKALYMLKDSTFSPVYTTALIGFDGAPEYLNAVALFRTLLSLEASRFSEQIAARDNHKSTG